MSRLVRRNCRGVSVVPAESPATRKLPIEKCPRAFSARITSAPLRGTVRSHRAAESRGCASPHDKIHARQSCAHLQSITIRRRTIAVCQTCTQSISASANPICQPCARSVPPKHTPPLPPFPAILLKRSMLDAKRPISAHQTKDLPAPSFRLSAKTKHLQQVEDSGGSRGLQPPERERNCGAFRPGPLPLFQELKEIQL
jgi:hypothetical protein